MYTRRSRNQDHLALEGRSPKDLTKYPFVPLTPLQWFWLWQQLSATETLKSGSLLVQERVSAFWPLMRWLEYWDQTDVLPRRCSTPLLGVTLFHFLEEEVNEVPGTRGDPTTISDRYSSLWQTPQSLWRAQLHHWSHLRFCCMIAPAA